MGLINVPPVTNGDANDENLYNSRFATIVNEINGNLNADNLATSAVTTPKIVDKGVTGEKLGLPVAFRATTTANVASTAATSDVTSYSEVFDLGSNFASGIFTAPYNGYYMFVGNVSFTNVGGTSLRMSAGIITSGGNALQYAHPIINSHDPGMNVSILVYLTSGQTAKMQAMQDSGSTKAMDSFSFFSGYLVGRA